MWFDSKREWSHKEPTENGGTVSIDVCEVENGFIIKKETYTKGGDGFESKSECKVYISSKNPLADKEEKSENPLKGIFDGVNAINVY